MLYNDIYKIFIHSTYCGVKFCPICAVVEVRAAVGRGSPNWAELSYPDQRELLLQGNRGLFLPRDNTKKNCEKNCLIIIRLF